MSMNFGDEDLNCIVLGSIPKHENLCCIIGTINFLAPIGVGISNKAYQCQIYKTRSLIFSNPEVLASPVFGALENIYIIVSLQYYKTGQLSLQLENMNIKVGDPTPVTNSIYESCLRYSILAKLAPSWNQVERYIVQGRDFLFSSAPLDAAKLDIVVNENDMHIALWPLRMRLPQVSVEILQLQSSQPQHLPWDISSCNPTVNVLPSLNFAKVLSVTDYIPESSVFKTYKDIKRHWKNSYGYRLQESEEGMIYVTVSFGNWSNEIFTYPVPCVRSQRRPVFLRQHAPEQLLTILLTDLQARVPRVCGHEFAIDATMRYTVPKLHALSQSLLSNNLTEIKRERKMENGVDCEDGVVGSAWIPSQPLMPYTQTQTTPFGKSGSMCSSILHEVADGIFQLPTKPTFTPTFNAKPKPKPTASSSVLQTPPNLNTKPKLPCATLPVFAPVFTKKHKPKLTASSSMLQTPPTFNTKPKLPGTTHPVFAPVFTTKHKPKPPSDSFPTPTEPVFTNNSESNPHHFSPSPTSVWEPSQQIPDPQPLKPIFGLSKKANDAKKLVSSCTKPKFGQSPSFSLGDPEKGTTKTLLHLPEQDASDGKKAKNRSRPQVQTGVDVQALVQTSEGLSRVNTATLIAYLRQNKVPCKVKDRKADLVAKVKAHLNLP